MRSTSYSESLQARAEKLSWSNLRWMKDSFHAGQTARCGSHLHGEIFSPSPQDSFWSSEYVMLQSPLRARNKNEMAPLSVFEPA